MFSSNGIFLKRLHLRSHQCFLETKKMEFEAGINIIAGANNAGKTALLDAACFRAPHVARHASPTTTPDPGGHPEEPSIRHYTLSVGASVWAQLAGTGFYLPISPDNVNADVGPGISACKSHMQQPTTEIRISVDESGGEPHPSGAKAQWANVQFSRDLQLVPGGSFFSGESSNSSLGMLLLSVYHSRTFMFNAERYHVGICAHGASDVLAPNAANLPEVLGTLQPNTNRFQLFNVLLNRVIPAITRVSVRPRDGNRLEIVVWKGDVRSERIDLTVPLNRCGTGLGQVLAILYVVSQSPFPRTILIDEPNTFLHPGAVASLLEVFQEYSQHQYIITTHSPGVISSSKPSTLHLLEAHGYETKVRSVSSTDIEDQRAILTSVGARLEDVFGPDRILWVEGPSEADVYPELARAFGIHVARVAFRALVSTGDFESRHAPLVARIYDSMARGVALIPPACGFLFDREKRSDEELARIQAAAPGRLWFTERRMLENYFLHSGAILFLLNRLGVDVDIQMVEDWWKKRAGDRAFAGRDTPGSAMWLQTVHGAKLITAAIRELSTSKQEYDKVRAAPVLMGWMIEHGREHVEGLATQLRVALASK